eukprot:gb/GECG01007987.1/.p1 GENE.gb/GECG01007987.1/~~gb/GECG01007987.1/.p1  ORF type:complete len:554 (+),score=67.68 gb/GECG01007987.1/:1-1662(+)
MSSEASEGHSGIHATATSHDQDDTDAMNVLQSYLTGETEDEDYQEFIARCIRGRHPIRIWSLYQRTLDRLMLTSDGGSRSQHRGRLGFGRSVKNWAFRTMRKKSNKHKVEQSPQFQNFQSIVSSKGSATSVEESLGNNWEAIQEFLDGLHTFDSECRLRSLYRMTASPSGDLRFSHYISTPVIARSNVHLEDPSVSNMALEEDCFEEFLGSVYAANVANSNSSVPNIPQVPCSEDIHHSVRAINVGSQQIEAKLDAFCVAPALVVQVDVMPKELQLAMGEDTTVGLTIRIDQPNTEAEILLVAHVGETSGLALPIAIFARTGNQLFGVDARYLETSYDAIPSMESLGSPMGGFDPVKSLLPEEAAAGRDAYRIPRVLKMLRTHLWAVHGHTKEGIFRLSPEFRLKERVQQMLEHGEFSPGQEGIPAEVVASLMKNFFAKLPKPPLDWIPSGDLVTTNSKERLLEVLQENIPPLERECLLWLGEMLSRISEFENLNKMNSAVLATVWAPSLVSADSATTNPAEAFSGLQRIIQLMTMLLDCTTDERQSIRPSVK